MPMKNLAVAIVLAASCLAAPQARSGEAATALSQCLTASVTPDDKRTLVRWIFSAIAAHPHVKELSAIDDGKREALETAGAQVFERLIAQDCTAQSRAAIVSEGTDGFAEAFKTLGEVAMGGAVEDPQVQAVMSRLGERLDTQRILKALLVQ